VAINFVRKPPVAVPPPQPATTPGTYTILTALAELAAGKKGTLMLVHKATGQGYQVMGYDPSTGKARLKGTQGQLLNPIVGEREASQYDPVWR
jgi:hypothetical protein